ncbi:MAG: DNA starvation/stationary phase protection protein [Planctomycetes bacterium]|nr:DNA starvation/stationary phase protection protein [Planctomycetota bacterium]
MKSERNVAVLTHDRPKVRPVVEGNGKHGNLHTPEQDHAAALPRETRPEVGLSGEHRHGAIRILNAVLADSYVLHTKCRNYHWNVSGPSFLQLHKFFQEQYEEVGSAVDEIAERVRMLGGHPIATLAEFLNEARLTEPAGEPPSSCAMLANLLADNEAVARQLRKDIPQCLDDNKDAGTADFLTGLLQKHEKTAWILRSLLTHQAKPEGATQPQSAKDGHCCTTDAKRPL